MRLFSSTQSIDIYPAQIEWKLLRYKIISKIGIEHGKCFNLTQRALKLFMIHMEISPRIYREKGKLLCRLLERKKNRLTRSHSLFTHSYCEINFVMEKQLRIFGVINSENQSNKIY